VKYIARDDKLVIFPLVPQIEVEYTIKEKRDIRVKITKLIENIAEEVTFIAYETNVNDIDKFIPDVYNSFSLIFTNQKNEDKEFRYLFRKYDNNPLLLICRPFEEGEFWLVETRNEIKITSHSIKYNFIIEPSNINDKIYANLDRLFL